MKQEVISYELEGQSFQGFIAYPKQSSPAPLVLVVHDWSGCNDFAREKAIKLSELGYVGFAIDMYGEGQIGQTNEEKSALIAPFMEDRSLLKNRIVATLAVGKQLPGVLSTKTAAIGFCFGGLCVLDLARSAVDVTGVVSFHGLLNAPQSSSNEKITSRVLALHGYDDPMATKENLIEFCDEMTARQANWQVCAYGHTQHAFMNPVANDKALGLVYQPDIAVQAWQNMQQFLAHIL